MQWVIVAVVHFLINQIVKFGVNISWDLAIQEAVDYFMQILPPSAKDLVVKIVTGVVGIFKNILSDAADLQNVADRLIAGDWSGAWSAIEQLLINSTHPFAASVLGAVKAHNAELTTAIDNHQNSGGKSSFI